MVRDIEAKKAKVKEDLCRAIDDYFEEFSERSCGPEFTMDDIERMMVGRQRAVRRILSESNGELVSGLGADVKKNAFFAVVECDASKKTKE